jgi:hypothetical protein
MTATERKRLQRVRDRSSGIVSLSVLLPVGQVEFLRKLAVEGFPELTFQQFIGSALLVGAAFRVNSGGSRKCKLKGRVTVSHGA